MCHEQSSYHNIYNNNRSLFEMVLGASHGSADFYLREPLSIDNNVEARQPQ